MTKTMIGLMVLSALIQSANAENETGCDASGGLTFVCGLQNAEDLVLVPQSQWVLSSGMAPGGGIYLIDSVKKTWRQLYSKKSRHIRHDKAAYASCPGAPEPESFMSHGLNIRAGQNGHATLYVVGHGGREAIEVFDVDANKSTPRLTWVGCIPMPKGLAANSVASFKDGSLVATVLMYPDKSFADMFAGETTGAIYEWSPGDTGFQLIRGTELPGNNGIEISEDEQEIFVASTGLRTVVAFSRGNPSRQLRTTRTMGFIPDNVHMNADGQLVSAGLSVDAGDCGGAGIENGDIESFAQCPRAFIVAVIDPETMKDTNLVERSANEAFSNITMALTVGDEVWIGTFSGDRIGVVHK